MRFYELVRTSCPHKFNWMVERGLAEDPADKLRDFRETAIKLTNPIMHGIPQVEASICFERIQDAIVGASDQIVSQHRSDENIRWQLARTLDRLKKPEEALDHLSFVCKVADTPELRARAFARNAEILIEAYNNSRDPAHLMSAFTSARQAHQIEGSFYTFMLKRRVGTTFLNSWSVEHGPDLLSR